ncbi:HD domain-containing protein, partial [Escherichia coli]|nr:HD domain-containing protein [Escherichia coli]
PDAPLVPPVSGIAALERHDSLGFYLWQLLIEDWENESNNILSVSDDRHKFKTALNSWILITTGHHGIPPDTLRNNSSLAFTDKD